MRPTAFVRRTSWIAGPGRAVAAALLVAVSAAVACAADAPRRPGSATEGTTFEVVGLQVLATATHLYFFAVGATIGSFLNVVVYRMPRGLGVVYPASRCPKCLTPIRMRDNIPIFSWLRLRGRCRACGEPISSRYLLVELGVGLMFWGLLMTEVVPGGANLPLRTPTFHRGVIWTVWSLPWDLLGIYVYHCWLLCVLVCLGLIRYDRQPAPSKLLTIGLFVGLVPPLVWPHLRPVPWSLLAEGSWRGPWAALIDGVAGVAAGVLVGGALAAGLREPRTRGDELRATCGAAALVGAYLGWQATVSTGLLAALLCLVAAILTRGLPAFARIPLCGFVGLAVFVQISAWRSLAFWPWWPGPEGRALPMVGAVAATAALAWIAGALLPESPSVPEEPAAPEAPPAEPAPVDAGGEASAAAGWPEDRSEPIAE
ncbi:MAG: prepilin peptidase [Pirellulales bacterium]